MKQIIQVEQNNDKNLDWQEVNRVAINFRSVVEDLNLGLPRTNPASGGQCRVIRSRVNITQG